MSLTINTTVEQEKMIASLAEKQGVSIDEYAIPRLLESRNSAALIEKLPEDTQLQLDSILAIDDPDLRIKEFLKSFADTEAPPIAPENMSREYIYERENDR